MQRKERRSKMKRRENADRRRTNNLDYNGHDRRSKMDRRAERDRRVLEEV